MCKVFKKIDGNEIWYNEEEYTFETIEEAVKFVSSEYCYYDYKYIRPEKFNCATTEKVIPSERPDDYDDYADDYHCEPFDDELRWAYVDCWDGVISWEIIPIKRYSTKFELEYFAYANTKEEAKKIAIEYLKEDLEELPENFLTLYSETREISENE